MVPLQPHSMEALKEFMERFHKRIFEIDRFATTVLKAHFLVEEELDSVLDSIASKPKKMASERNPTFDQKLKWIRKFHPLLRDSEYWRLIAAFNTLRNKVAHKFDGPERKRAIENLRKEYREVVNPDPKNKEFSPEILVLAIGAFSVTFLGRFRELIVNMEE